MRKWLLAVVSGIVLLGMAGCSGTIPIDAYSPQNIVRYQHNNAVDVGQFTYAPEKAGELMPNQLENTAAGSVYLSTGIAEMVRRVTALELEKTGLFLDGMAKIVISGEVIKFIADDYGYSVDWTYAVVYTITDKDNGAELFRDLFEPEGKKTSKFGSPSDYSSVIYEMVLSGYNMFIKDSRVKAILDE